MRLPIVTVHKKGIFTAVSVGLLGKVYLLDVFALMTAAVLLLAQPSRTVYRPLSLVWRLVLCLPIFDGFISGLLDDASAPSTPAAKQRKRAETAVRLLLLLNWFL